MEMRGEEEEYDDDDESGSDGYGGYEGYNGEEGGEYEYEQELHLPYKRIYEGMNGE